MERVFVKNGRESYSENDRGRLAERVTVAMKATVTVTNLTCAAGRVAMHFLIGDEAGRIQWHNLDNALPLLHY